MKKPYIKDLPDELLESLLDDSSAFLLVDGCRSSKDWKSFIKNEKAPLILTELHYTNYHIKINKDMNNYQDFRKKLYNEQLIRNNEEPFYK